MKTMTKTSNRTKAKKTAGRGKPADRKGDKRKAPDQAGGIDLLRLADQVGLQQYAAEGFRDRQTRAMGALVRLLDSAEDKPADEPMDMTILKLQYIREMGRLSPDEVFAGLDLFAEEIAWEDRELNRLSAAIDAMYKEYGAKDDEHWAVGEGPEEFEKLRNAFDDRFRQLKASILRHYAENEMADLLLNDPDAYAVRIENGRKLTEKNRAAGKYSGKVNDDKAK